jgi:hypothetical protein
MSPKELKDLVKTLRSLGVTSYDDGQGVKLTLSADAPTKRRREPKLTKEKKQEIEHKIQEFTSLMKISDMELVDRLFPDTQQDAEESH